MLPTPQGEGYRCWVADSGAQVGDAIAMKRQGSWVLVRLVPADTGKQPASVDRSDRPAPADEAERPALAAQAAAPASAGGACPGQDVSQQGSPDAPARQADQCSAEQHVKVGASRRSRWAHAGDGWWHTRLSATACGATASPIQLRLPGELPSGGPPLLPSHLTGSRCSPWIRGQCFLVFTRWSRRSTVVRPACTSCCPTCLQARMLLCPPPATGRPGCVQPECLSRWLAEPQARWARWSSWRLPARPRASPTASATGAARGGHATCR